ncbi:unnamed protein product [Paramecium sonneborni]|uniref:Tetratricopeptide repeat protein n=1 Tax=Paramecium sonneborni TaxID=65129 RepID=A0A8S1RPM9_9CILI|nr:unnamed protein product [Paramecium sonneborni]
MSLKDLLNQGDTLYYLNIYSEALEFYEKAISISPKNDGKSQGIIIIEKLNQSQKAIQWLGLHKLNRYQEATECFDKAISINLKYQFTQVYKGLALDKLNYCQKAIERSDKVISIIPQSRILRIINCQV